MSTPDTAPVRIERDGDLAVVVLDRPPLNLFDESVFAGFEDAVAQLVGLTAPGRPDRARGVLVEARGKVVSAGVQVQAFGEIAEGPDPVGRGTALWARLIRVAQTIEELPVPTVFAAHGLTLTAAFEIALACDLLLAAEGASFGLVEIVVGLTPSMGGPQRLAERAGPARAKELVFTGERYPASVLREWGVVNRVLPDDGFAAAAREFTQRITAGPTVAHAATKTLVTTAVRDGVRAADAVLPAVSGPLFGTDDLRGAVASFLADGPGRATYQGR
ncbi:enoyl-CoA hydratase/isomerase family protein [Pseudonocardia petroleophila]|uniref:Enoyl-CoA hydratase/isomerase family protein n=1 Tax=Pseudonocardia petroleophila TaxID=37331 RepID=A0A7G7MEW2_9PSEU|nr:enoyl-CoA hydratase/isomerase family protein [Pseudonocardia petroleophila]QNG51323.1 enoyl-CoA hydratase/isomerase family protein [Pseudonocardia petroleophila]